MLVRWALFIFKRAVLVIIVALGLLAGGAVYGSSVFSHVETGGQDFQDPASDSAAFSRQYPKAFPNTQGQYIVLFSSPATPVDTPAYGAEVNGFTTTIRQLPHVTTVTGYYLTGSGTFVSADRHDTFVVISVQPGYQDGLYGLLNAQVAGVSGPATAQLGGAAAINKQINVQIEKDLQKAEMISFPILAVLLVLFFDSLVAAVIPLVLGGLGIVSALAIMRLLAEVTTISAYAINVVTLLGLGLAIDYSLFMVSRFREELRQQHDDAEVALAIAVGKAGHTILSSGTMVACSLLSLLVFPQTFLRSIGLGGAAVVATMVFLALTILPATLRLLGRRVNALKVIRRPEPAIALPEIPTFRFWYQFTRVVMRWAVVAIVVVLVPLLLVANQFRRVALGSTTDISNVPTSLSGRQVNDTLQLAFPGFNAEPINLLVRVPAGPLTANGQAAIRQYVTALQRLPGVAHVDSLAAVPAPLLDSPAAAGLRQQYVSGNTSVIRVYQTAGAQSEAAQQLVKNIRAMSPPVELAVQAGGATAELVDLLHSLRQHVPAALVIICLATFVLVFLLTGSVILPIKAIILDLLSLSAALGIVAWVFQNQHLDPHIPLTALGSVDATSGVLIFAVAFGLSADYEFFLLSRVKEEYDATGDNTHAISYGVQRTIGIISAAALLFVTVIGLFMTSRVSLLQQIGLGLSVAVIIDATLVRLILVAATMRILGNLNWWSPGFPRLGWRKHVSENRL